MNSTDLDTRAARHAALADPHRLAIVDELTTSDRTPTELRQLVGVESNLLAHHLDVLERVGLVQRSRSSGDGRRRYVHLLGENLPLRRTPSGGSDRRALFVCSRNSARSQLAAALWATTTGSAAASAGTHPADAIAPGALAAARRAGIEMPDAAPRSLDSVGALPPLVVTVCDQAHEELTAPLEWLHWSVPDPVGVGTDEAYDATIAELRERIGGLTSPHHDG